MHAIVVGGADVGLSLHSYFPVVLNAAVFVISKRSEKTSVYIVSLQSSESIYTPDDFMRATFKVKQSYSAFDSETNKHFKSLI